MGMFSRARRDGYYVSYGPSTYRSKYKCTREGPDVVYTTAPEGRVATVARQTCASCGRFRSAKWEADHPLLPGRAASSSICARCQRDKTSSGEERPKCRCKRKHHRHRHCRRCTEATDDSYCSIKDRRSPRRYRSDSRDYSRPRASSRDNIRIVIANQPGVRAKRESTQSSSREEIRVVRRTSIVEIPERVRSRSNARSSSRAHYLDDGTAQYVEELVRPRYRSRPRSMSRSSYIEEIVPRRSRSKRRSSTSHVQFVDDPDEPLLVSRPPKRITRRRAVYFDGAASFEPSQHEDRGRQRPRPSFYESRDSEGGVQLVSNEADRQSLGAEHIRDAVTPDPPRNSKSTSVLANHYPQQSRHSDNDEEVDLVHINYHTSIRSGTYNVDFGSEQTPNPKFRSLDTQVTARRSSEPTFHKRSHSKLTPPKPSSVSLGAIDNSQNANPGPTPHGAETTATPRTKRRRRYRDDSTEDDYVTAGYRHVRAPSPPAPQPHADYLSEMLQSSHITPPHQQSHWQSGLGPPSPPRSRSASISEGSTAYRPPFYRDFISDGIEYGPATHQYSPVEDLYGNKVTSYDYDPTGEHRGAQPDDVAGWPQSAAVHEYDWMV